MSEHNEVGALPDGTAVSAEVSFRDKAYRTRSVVFPDGRSATVERSLVAVSEPEHVRFLDHHADFERFDGGART
jgi:hypothetical protein